MNENYIFIKKKKSNNHLKDISKNKNHNNHSNHNKNDQIKEENQIKNGKIIAFDNQKTKNLPINDIDANICIKYEDSYQIDTKENDLLLKEERNNDISLIKNDKITSPEQLKNSEELKGEIEIEKGEKDTKTLVTSALSSKTKDEMPKKEFSAFQNGQISFNAPNEPAILTTKANFEKKNFFEAISIIKTPSTLQCQDNEKIKFHFNENNNLNQQESILIKENGCEKNNSIIKSDDKNNKNEENLIKTNDQVKSKNVSFVRWTLEEVSFNNKLIKIIFLKINY